MKSKWILPCLLMVCLVIAFKLIPWKQMPGDTHDNRAIGDIINCIVMAFICWYAAKKINILQDGGFKGFRLKNAWMGLIPLLYPGMMMFEKGSFACQLPLISLVLFVMASLANGLFEELIFRGLMHGYLLKHNQGRPVFRVSLISAVFFGLTHLFNLVNGEMLSVFSQVIFAFFIGLLFSALIIRMKNIWLLGLIHGSLNILAGGTCDMPILESAPVYHFVDYLRALFFPALIFSPVLIFYWLLIKGIKPAPEGEQKA